MSLPALNNYELTTSVEKHFNSPQVRNVNEEHVYAILTALLTKTFQIHGQSKEQEDFSFTLNELYKYVKKNLIGLTIREIQKVFEKGWRGDYGKYYGINMKTFMTWFESYKEIDRKNKIIELNKNKKQKELTELEKNKIKNEAVINSINYFLDNREVDVNRLYVYDILYELGYLPKDKEYKDEVLIRAKKAVRSYYENKTASTLDEKRAIKSFLSNFEKQPKIIVKCWELVLMDFYTELSKDLIKLDEFIKKFEP